MPSLNEADIDQALDLARRYAPEFHQYVEYLSDWRHTVNRNSDGWCYWRIASKAAAKLQDLTKGLEEWIRAGGDSPHRYPMPPKPTHEQFKKALTPIKTFATKHKLPAPELKVPQVAGG